MLPIVFVYLSASAAWLVATAGASMPNPIFICGESGLVGPQFDGIPNFTPESWKDILDFCDELATTPGDFRTLVIDTLDWVEPMLYAHVCAEGKQKNIEGFGYGRLIEAGGCL